MDENKPAEATVIIENSETVAETPTEELPNLIILEDVLEEAEKPIVSDERARAAIESLLADLAAHLANHVQADHVHEPSYPPNLMTLMDATDAVTAEERRPASGKKSIFRRRLF